MNISLRTTGKTSNVFNVAGFDAQLAQALDNIADTIKTDFEGTVAGWKSAPAVSVSKISQTAREISITDQRYFYVSEGTSPHIIQSRPGSRLAFQGGYSASTQPGSTSSGSNSRSGNTVFTSVVHHPGTKARKFDKQIAAKWQSRFPNELAKVLKTLQG